MPQLRKRGAGFTLVELMVVVAIVIILSTVAIMTLKPSASGGGALGYSRQILSEIEDMRVRAVSTRRWQRLNVGVDVIVHEESTTVGMTQPVAWQLVRILSPSQSTEICAFTNTLAVNPTGGIACGTGVPNTDAIVVRPDGSGQLPGTIFIQNIDGHKDQYRVTVYRATAMPILSTGF